MLDKALGSAVDLARMFFSCAPANHPNRTVLTVMTSAQGGPPKKPTQTVRTTSIVLEPKTTPVEFLMLIGSRRGCLREGNLCLMGHLHPDHAPHRSSLHQLLFTTEKSDRHPRDCRIHLRRYVFLWPPRIIKTRPDPRLTRPLGMIVGLTLRVAGGETLQNLVSFDYQIFFNLLLPPIILSSGYELHQSNFFRNIGTILTFAFAGTFLSAMVIGIILWLYTRIPLDGLNMTWVDAISVGATLSATDPVTILAIFNSYKVDPKLYTIIFGESILNDAIAIVIFEAAQKAKSGPAELSGLASLFFGIGTFLFDFFGSLAIGVVVGIAAALGLKYTYVRRYPKIESCLIVLIAYSTYFFSQAIKMSGKCGLNHQLPSLC